MVDDKGQSACSNTSVMVMAPQVAPRPQTSELCRIQFGRDVRRPSRVDNEAKGCLVNDKGIDASRIAVYTGSADEMSVSTTLIGAEATLNAAGLTPVVSSQIEKHPVKPARRPARRPK